MANKFKSRFYPILSNGRFYYTVTLKILRTYVWKWHQNDVFEERKLPSQELRKMHGDLKELKEMALTHAA